MIANVQGTFPHYLQCTLTQRLFCCCEFAGSPTAVVPEVAPALDIPAMLCAQPARSHWCKQEAVERDLGLEHRGISTYICDQRRLPEGNKRLKEISTKLTAAGVYRFLGSRFPTRVWWLAFTGKGGTEPIFAEWGEDNSFGREEDGSGEVPDAAPRNAIVSGDKGGKCFRCRWRRGRHWGRDDRRRQWCFHWRRTGWKWPTVFF